jgi:hypothetical protein
LDFICRHVSFNRMILIKASLIGGAVYYR